MVGELFREHPASHGLMALPVVTGAVIYWSGAYPVTLLPANWLVPLVLLWAGILASALAHADLNACLRNDRGLVVPWGSRWWPIAMLGFWPLLLVFHFRARRLAGYRGRPVALVGGLVCLLFGFGSLIELPTQRGGTKEPSDLILGRMSGTPGTLVDAQRKVMVTRLSADEHRARVASATDKGPFLKPLPPVVESKSVTAIPLPVSLPTTPTALLVPLPDLGTTSSLFPPQ